MQPQPARSADPRTSIATAFALGVPRDYGRARDLARVREPKRLGFIGYDTQNRPQWLSPRAARAWTRMRDAAARDGVELQIVSAFRSVEHQLGILKRKLERGLDIVEILRVSAAPGYSEHHSGRALDITTPGCAGRGIRALVGLRVVIRQRAALRFPLELSAREPARHSLRAVALVLEDVLRIAVIPAGSKPATAGRGESRNQGWQPPVNRRLASCSLDPANPWRDHRACWYWL
jgi:hypothetical protein